MPKQKSVRGASKRFKVTGSGKIKYKRASLRHILTKRSSQVKRKLRALSVLSDNDVKHVKTMLPYI
ncbi:MAG: 50S ribosomal protein L35 [Nitrospinota bacterium]